MSNLMQSSDGKKQVQFQDQQNDNYTIPMQEKKFISTKVNIINPKSQGNNQNDIEKKIMNPINQVIRYNFTDEMDKILNMIDQRQTQRLQKIQNIINQQNKENQEFIHSLKDISEQVMKQQQLSHDYHKQYEYQSKYTKFNNGNTSIDGTYRPRSSTVRGNSLDDQQIQQQQQQSQQNMNGLSNNSSKYNNMNNSQKTNNLNNSQYNNKNEMMIEENINIQSQVNNNQQQTQENSDLNDIVIIQQLNDLGINFPKNKIKVNFTSQKVEDFNEDQVDGYYFQITKQSKINYEFYIYQIANIEEIEYNPIIISNRNVSDYDSTDLESLSHFYSILSFSTGQLFGFFQNFFQYVLNDQSN